MSQDRSCLCGWFALFFFHCSITMTVNLDLVLSQTNLDLVLSQTNLDLVLSQTNLDLVLSQTNLNLVLSQTNDKPCIDW